MKKTKTWKARRLEVQRRKRLRVQRETRRLLAKHPLSWWRRRALSHERKAKRAARPPRRARREWKTTWVADGFYKPPPLAPRSMPILGGPARAAMMMAALLMAGAPDDR